MHKSSYFEGILQIRPAPQEIIDFVIKQVANRKDIFISKMQVLDTGVNLFISNKSFTVALGKMIKTKFKAKITLSNTLVTVSHETGKELFRVTVLARLPKPEREEESFDKD